MWLLRGRATPFSLKTSVAVALAPTIMYHYIRTGFALMVEPNGAYISGHNGILSEDLHVRSSILHR